MGHLRERKKYRKERRMQSHVLCRSYDTLHRFKRSPRSFPDLPVHPRTNRPRKTAPTRLGEMSTRAFDPCSTEFRSAPRELDDHSKRGTTGVGRGIDECVAERATELSVFEDQRLALRVAIGKIGQGKRGLNHDVRAVRLERPRERAKLARDARRVEHRIDVVLAVGKVAQEVQRLLAHCRVCVVEALVE